MLYWRLFTIFQRGIQTSTECCARLECKRGRCDNVFQHGVWWNTREFSSRSWQCGTRHATQVWLVKYNDDNTWEVAADVNKRRLYSFGDRKSNENCSAFVSTLSHRPLTLEESSMQAEIFLESFQNIMFLPGNWHTSMNMLQSFYKVFWTNILSPIKSFFGWKWISKDVQGCYFQAAHLVRNIHNVLSTYLLRCSVSSIFNDIAESMYERANADVLCNVAILYREWLMKSLKLSDQHLRLCVHFMTMLGNFLEFVNAYCCQDSITG